MLLLAISNNVLRCCLVVTLKQSLIMKFLISSVFLLFLFSANATEIQTVDASSKANQIEFYPKPGKKKNRKNKRTNKRRKRKCSQWGRKSYAG